VSTTVLDWLELRVLSFYHEALQIRNGQMPAPRMGILYPTYACNHRCRGCDYTELNRQGGSLTEAGLDRVLDQLLELGVQSVEFCGGGEPTLHPSLVRAIDRLAAAGVAFGLLTNGTCLTDPLVERLVARGSYCRVSVEAGSRSVFERYKRPVNGSAGFDTVMANIERLVAARNAAVPRSRLQISYKYSLDATNWQDARRAVDLAHRLQVDSIQFKCIRNVPTEITDSGLIDRIARELQDSRGRHPGMRILAGLGRSSLGGSRCWLSPLQVTIDALGDAYICCYYRHRRDAHRLGNVLAQGLREIWYSQEHWRRIAAIDPADCDRYDCRFHGYNRLMHELVAEDVGQLAFI
jgi:MoaA/NifB/PqqE/SkfB family radical SAM enzyme